ncbi:MAG: DUF1302 family protein, partial [Salinisphaeraceae bacterium]|nr:DUF1302 family protein [Salinisphaeraceae bacterium]
MDDVLGEFGSLDDFDNVEVSTETIDPYAWDIGGSLSASFAYNTEDHRSSTGTDYDGLSRARLRVNLSLDKRFSENWRIHLSGYAWRDFVYEYHDRAYTDEVLDAYETDTQIQDAYIQGKLSQHWDVWLGRQVVVWGFADNLRVLDILNPLDNLEPAIADIEDLRRPVGMLRLNHFRGRWTVGLIAIPEQRFSRLPPFGSDFYPTTDAEGNALKFREEEPEDFEDINYAASLVGRFSGWDLSFNLARLWFDEPYLDPTAFDINDPDADEDSFNEAAVLRHSRVNMAGFGFQFTQGSWLFKQEASVIDGLLLTRTSEVTASRPIPLLGTLPIVGGLLPQFSGSAVLPNSLSEHRQTNALLGVEYYGFKNTSIGVEVAARYIDDFDDSLAASGYIEKRTESSLRITRDFLREKLRATLVLIAFDRDNRFGNDGGSIYRLNLDYELGPALELSGGAVI